MYTSISCYYGACAAAAATMAALEDVDGDLDNDLEVADIPGEFEGVDLDALLSGAGACFLMHLQLRVLWVGVDAVAGVLCLQWGSNIHGT